MIETLLAEISVLEMQKEKYSTLLEQTEIGTAKYDAIKIELDKTVSKLETKESELNEQRDQTERRAQQQEESLDALATFVTELGLYRLAKPVPEDGERLTEYTETEKEFNEIVYFGYRDYTKSLQDEFNRQDDAQVRFIAELNRMNVETSREYAELQQTYDKLLGLYNNARDEINIKDSEIENERLQSNKTLELLNSTRTENFILMDRIKDLTEQIEKKPVAAPQLSGTLQDKIASFKQNNTIKSNLELVLSGELPARGKVVLGGSDRLEAPPLSFDIESIVESNQLPIAETTEAVEQFRTTEESAGHELADETSSVDRKVTRQEFEGLKQEVATLKQYVQGLEGYEEVA